jgi:MATE family multidrug resistance protein
MLVSFGLYLATVWAAASLGNAGLWLAMLAFLATRGLGQALAYPMLVRRTFAGLEPAERVTVT